MLRGWASDLLNHKVWKCVSCAGSWGDSGVEAEGAYSGIVEVFEVGGIARFGRSWCCKQ